jgi:hypothetical protein
MELIIQPQELETFLELELSRRQKVDIKAVDAWMGRQNDETISICLPSDLEIFFAFCWRSEQRPVKQCEFIDVNKLGF